VGNERILEIAKHMKLRYGVTRCVAPRKVQYAAPTIAPEGDVELATYGSTMPENTPSVAIAMVTTDRKEPTIFDTLQNCRDVGFKQRIQIFSQAYYMNCDRLYAQDKHIAIHDTTRTRGGTANWKAAALHLSKSSAEWVLILEDDLQWCRHGAAILYYTLRQIEQGDDGIKLHRLGLLSAYTSPAMVASASAVNGWTEAQFAGATKGLWGALALCLPMTVLRALIKHPAYTAYDCKSGIDYLIGNILRGAHEPPLEVKVHVPSLVEHTGAHSTIFSDEVLAAPGLDALRHGYKFDYEYNEVSK